MSQSLIERENANHAEPFARMASRIEHNDLPGERFGGAFVIVDPEGNIKELLMLDNNQSPAMFWSNVKTIAEMAIAELEERQRALQGYGYR